MSVMVLLRRIRHLLTQGYNRHILEPLLRQCYERLEVILGSLTYKEETNGGTYVTQAILELVYKAEDYVDELYRKCSIEQPLITPRIDCEEDLSEDIEVIINKIEGLMSGGAGGSRRSEYDSTREKAVQMLKQSLPRTTRGWVIDPEAEIVVDSTKHCGRLVDRLINGGPPKLDRILISGNDETGMTHLAKKVYNDASVIGYFDCRAWVLISGTYVLRNLLLNILNDIMKDITKEEMYDHMDEWELKRQIRKLLGDRRYLIVFENVPNSYLWNHEMKDTFPVNNKGSRMIFTTNSYLMSFGLTFDLKSCNPYSESRKCNDFYLEEQSTEAKWEHFSKMIFGENESPEELKHLGTSIVQNCGSQLFVGVTVACLLRASEKTVFRWSNMVGRFNELGQVDHPLKEYLTICYHEMPRHLKYCLLYVGVFPGGVDISVKQLIRLWIAEGVIQWVEDTDKTNKARSMEDVAEEDYLEGLIGLNFIQVTARRSDGGPKTFRIRDSVREVCINMLSKENFIEVHDSYKGKVHASRLCALNDCWGFTFVSNLRSFYGFSKHIQHTVEDRWKAFFKQSPLLRVLNLGEVEVAKLPEDILGKLFHLRYLSIKPAKYIRVPKSIFNLSNLETIDLRTTRFSELPEGIWKMQQLRHLFLNGDGQSRLPNPECEDWTLPNLQTLSYVSVDPEDDINISERAPNLKKLGLYGFRCFPITEQHVTFNFPPHLRALKFVEECAFEEQIQLPNTITKITLKGIHLEQNIIDTFGELPNLQILKLVETSFYEGELIFREGSFPQLHLLKFEASNIVTWKLAERAMPNLHRLVINKCSQLTELPSELWKVKTLQELELSWASSRLAKKLDDDLKENKGLKLVIHSTSTA